MSADKDTKGALVDVPNNVAELLQTYKTYSDSLLVDNFSDFWIDLRCLLISEGMSYNDNNEDYDDVGVVRDDMVSLVSQTLQLIQFNLKYDAYFSSDFIEYLVGLNDFFLSNKSVEFSCKVQISEVCAETLRKCEQSVFTIEHCMHWISILLEKIKVTLPKAYKKALNGIKSVVSYMSKFETLEDCYNKEMFQHIICIFKTEKLMGIDFGVELAGVLLSCNKQVLTGVQTFLCRELISCDKQKSRKFGRVYVHAWNFSNEGMKTEIENRMQYFMERAFYLTKNGTATQKRLHNNAFSFLYAIHDSRKVATFSGVVTRLYEPFLWHNLSSWNNRIRFNALKILTHVYPLEKPREGFNVYSKFVLQQHTEMINYLYDRCPEIRVSAIKGVCSNMRYFWNTFQNGSSEKILSVMINDLIQDGSSTEVRSEVYTGLRMILLNEESYPIMRTVIPRLKSYIHDESQKVRYSYIKLLLMLKEKNCGIKVAQLIKLRDIVQRLALDDDRSGKLLVKLIFGSIYGKSVSREDTVVRLHQIAGINSMAARKLMLYSEPVTTFADRTNIIQYLIVAAYKSVKYRFETNNENDNRIQQEGKDKDQAQNRVRDDSNVLSDISNEPSVVNSSIASVDNTKISACSSGNATRDLIFLGISEPRILHCFLDMISILWESSAEDFNKKFTSTQLDDLYTLTRKCVSLVLRHYKNTPAYFGAINLAALLPSSKIVHLSTIVSCCNSFLRNVTASTSEKELQCVIHALLVWKRGDEIVDLIVEWLDHAFRPQSLNDSMYPQPLTTSRRVRFESENVDPSLALLILKTILTNPIEQNMMFIRHGSCIVKFYDYLSRVKVLIQQRLVRDVPFESPWLTDYFLQESFALCIKLPVVCKINNVGSFNVVNLVKEIQTWTDEVIIPKISEDIEITQDTPFIAQLLKDIVMLFANIVAMNMEPSEKIRAPNNVFGVDESCIIEMLDFTSRATNTGVGIYLVELTLQLIIEVFFYMDAYVSESNKRSSNILIHCVPVLFENITVFLHSTHYDDNQLNSFIRYPVIAKKNLQTICNAMATCFEYRKGTPLYGVAHSVFEAIIKSLVQLVKDSNIVFVTERLKKFPASISYLGILLTGKKQINKLLFKYFNEYIMEKYITDEYAVIAVSSLLYTFACMKKEISATENEFKDIIETLYRQYSPRQRNTSISNDYSDADIQIQFENGEGNNRRINRDCTINFNSNCTQPMNIHVAGVTMFKLIASKLNMYLPDL